MNSSKKKNRRLPVLVLATALSSLASSLSNVLPASAGQILDTEVAQSGNEQTTKATNFVNIPGASVTVTVPAGVANAKVIVRFTGESSCSGGSAIAACRTRILIDGEEALPGKNDFVFDSNHNGIKTVNSGESHVMEGALFNLAPGTYKVQVQWKTTDPATIFILDDWFLTGQVVADVRAKTSVKR